MGLGQKLGQCFPHLLALHGLRRHIMRNQLVHLGGQPFVQPGGGEVIVHGGQNLPRVFRVLERLAQDLQGFHEGLTGVLYQGACLRAAPCEGRKPQLAPNAVGKDVVFQVPGVLLGDGSVAGFDHVQHFRGAVPLRHRPQGGQKKAHGPVGDDGQLPRHIGRDAVGTQHRGQHPGKAGVAHGHSHVAEIHALFVEQHHFLGGEVGLEIGVGGGVKPQAGRNARPDLRRIAQVFPGKMGQGGNLPGIIEGQQGQAAGNARLPGLLLQTGHAVPHGDEGLVLSHHDQHPHVLALPGQGDQQPVHLPGEDVEAVHRRPGVPGDAAFRQAAQHIVQHVLPVHELAGQAAFVFRVQQGKIRELVPGRALRQGLRVGAQGLRRHLGPLEGGDQAADAFNEALPVYGAFIVFQVFFAFQQSPGQGQLLAPGVDAHLPAGTRQGEHPLREPGGG